MRSFIMTDGDLIVGKFRQPRRPKSPDGLEVVEVDDLSEYSVDSWFFD